MTNQIQNNKGERHSIAVCALACRSRGPRIESRKGQNKKKKKKKKFRIIIRHDKFDKINIQINLSDVKKLKLSVILSG